MPAVGRLIDDALTPASFFVPPSGRVRIERSAGWWGVWLDRDDFPHERPVVEVALASDGGGVVSVTRNLRMRGGGWMSEPAGTIRDVCDEGPTTTTAGPVAPAALLRRCIGFALTGTSRLAIASIETPHPAFGLGMLAYLPHETPGGPAPTLDDRARSVEARLRAGLDPGKPSADAAAVVRVLFNHLALSPYTSLVDRLIAFVLGLGRDAALDLLGYMLRHLARHLNAFDLVRFHNQGANYPDALMLDAVLRAFIPLLGDDHTRLQRRALRQGWLARRRCDGLRVPDHPTSPGDNARDLPAIAPVPRLQLTDPATRTRRLFADAPADTLLTPATRRMLVESLADLTGDTAAAEVAELGTAVFLDRPLGILAGKRDGQADRTALLSYEAVSQRVIRSRLNALCDAGLLTDERRAAICLPTLSGIYAARLPGHARRGVVSLEDAKKAAFDFVFTRTTRSSLEAMRSQYDWSALNAARPSAYEWLAAGPDVLLVRLGAREISAIDADRREVFRIEAPDAPCCIEFGGVEYVSGLSVVIGEQKLPLPPRWGG